MEPNKNYLLTKASSQARRLLVHLLGYPRFHFAEPSVGIIKVLSKKLTTWTKVDGRGLMISERRGLPASPQGSLEPRAHDL